MSLRNVTLTAVAALSFGMAAHAQTTTITVPLQEPGAAAPAPTAPGTTVTRNADGTTSVETTGAAPAAAAVQSTASGSADASRPAPAAGPAESAQTAQTGTAQEQPATEPTPTPAAGEPPAAPKEGLPAAATADQVTAPVPSTESPATLAPATDASVPAVPANTAPAAEAPAAVEAPATEAANAAPAEGAPAAPAAEAAPADAAAAAPAADTPAAAEHAEAAGHEAPAGEAAHASHDAMTKDVAFSFEGPFGRYDQFELQRGLQVYTEVCSACHGMKQVPIRTLSDKNGPGIPEDQVRAYAANLTIVDVETGEERPRLPTDKFPTVTGMGMGPDLSLMAKARAGYHGPYGTGINQLMNGMGGPEHIYSILTGYTGETKEQAGTTFYENTAFPGGWISMPPPLSDGQVEFADGAPNDLGAEAKDVAAFLMWAAEPKMMDRKQVGFVAVLFLALLTVLLYLTNKRLWWPLKHRNDALGDGR